jgi:hypothetical protein
VKLLGELGNTYRGQRASPSQCNSWCGVAQPKTFKLNFAIGAPLRDSCAPFAGETPNCSEISCHVQPAERRLAILAVSRTTRGRPSRFPRAFARLTKSAAVALYYFSYNFIKIHRTLRVSPAMAAGVTDRLWSVSDLVGLWEAEERRSERAA